MYRNYILGWVDWNWSVMYGLELNWILVGRIEMDGWMDWI